MAVYKTKTTWRPLPENSTQSKIAPRNVCLHTAVSNGNSLYNYWNSSASEGVESHFYVRKDGTAEQYMDTIRRADCQVDGNAFCISIESWDGAGVVWDGRDVSKCPPWTTQQVQWIAEFLAWANKTHGIPLRQARYWNDSGISYHSQFIGDPGYARNPRACPTNARIKQIPGIISMAARIVNEGNVTPPPQEEDVPLSQGDIDKVALAVNNILQDDFAKCSWDRMFKEYYDNDGNLIRDSITTAHALFLTQADAAKLYAKVDALNADYMAFKEQVTTLLQKIDEQTSPVETQGQ